MPKPELTPQMKYDKIVAVGLLTEADLGVLGQGFRVPIGWKTATNSTIFSPPSIAPIAVDPKSLQKRAGSLPPPAAVHFT